MSALPTLELLQQWLNGDEDEHLEFKEAKNAFDSERLTKYLLNEMKREGRVHVRGGRYGFERL